MGKANVFIGTCIVVLDILR